MASYFDQPIIVGNTVKFRLLAKKDGVVWDLTGATVSLYLLKPDGSTVLGPYVATIDDGPAGDASYQVSESVLDTAGPWALQFKVSKSGIVLRSRVYGFNIYDRLAA